MSGSFSTCLLYATGNGSSRTLLFSNFTRIKFDCTLLTFFCLNGNQLTDALNVSMELGCFMAGVMISAQGHHTAEKVLLTIVYRITIFQPN